MKCFLFIIREANKDYVSEIQVSSGNDKPYF